jgi:hypothetical protein
MTLGNMREPPDALLAAVPPDVVRSILAGSSIGRADAPILFVNRGDFYVGLSHKKGISTHPGAQSTHIAAPYLHNCRTRRRRTKPFALSYPRDLGNRTRISARHCQRFSKAQFPLTHCQLKGAINQIRIARSVIAIT